jgi:hypothetical protein
VGRARRFHRSKWGVWRCVVGSAVVAAVACNRAPVVTARAVTVHAPKSCVTQQTPLDAQAYVSFEPMGDFDPPGQPPGGLFFGTVGARLSAIPDDTLALVAEVTEADREWQGVCGVPATGGVDVLVTPLLTACSLTTPATAAGSRSGAVLAPFGSSAALLVGGAGPSQPASASKAVPTYVADLETGVVLVASPDLLTPRERASVTAFGAGALVAGGVDPRTTGTVLATAEVFDPAIGGFDQQAPIMLSEARASAGAVVLPTGETLLVGGVGADGTTALASMEIVDPTTRTVRTANVAQLSVARSSPTVLLLASGEVLVVGGVDGSGNAVDSLEWFSADVSSASQLPAQLASGVSLAAVALEAGGALVVVTPPAGAPPTFQNVWMVDADGALEAATSLGGSITQPVLFGGAGGAPLLWTGAAWLRWQPWQGAFADADVIAGAPTNVGAVAASPDPGLALWLDTSDLALTALRFDAQSAYAPLPGPLLATDDADVAPDRLAVPGVVSFDPATGVSLAAGASVFVTDRTYASATIDVDEPTGEPVLVVLRDPTGVELEVGGATCPGALAVSAGHASTLHVERAGAAVTWSVDGGASQTCATGVSSTARLSVGLRGPENASQAVAANLTVAR